MSIVKTGILTVALGLFSVGAWSLDPNMVLVNHLMPGEQVCSNMHGKVNKGLAYVGHTNCSTKNHVRSQATMRTFW